MAKFRKKPVVIEAVQWTGTNTDFVLAFTRGRASVRNQSVCAGDAHVLILDAGDITMRVEPNDWMLRDVTGCVYVCPAALFAELYEAVE